MVFRVVFLLGVVVPDIAYFELKIENGELRIITIENGEFLNGEWRVEN